MDGEAFSPFLFSLYINDFESDFFKSVCKPTQLKDMSLFLLMFAYDTVLLSESIRTVLKKSWVITVHDIWNIYLNVTKTKVVVIRKGSKLP